METLSLEDAKIEFAKLQEIGWPNLEKSSPLGGRDRFKYLKKVIEAGGEDNIVKPTPNNAPNNTMSYEDELKLREQHPNLAISAAPIEERIIKPGDKVKHIIHGDEFIVDAVKDGIVLRKVNKRDPFKEYSPMHLRIIMTKEQVEKSKFKL